LAAALPLRATAIPRQEDTRLPGHPNVPQLCRNQGDTGTNLEGNRCEVPAAVSESEIRRSLEVAERARESAYGADILAMFFRFRADSQARKAIAGASTGMVFTRSAMIP
jgi:hypothetical protein